VAVVVGDATDDDVLMGAGIERAASLIAALGSDNDSLSLTLAARSLRSDVRIVARVADGRNKRKFARAGADRVVNPYEIGGSRMAAIAFRPHVAEFLDEVIHAAEYDVDIHELVVTPGSQADGVPLGELIDRGTAAAVVAVKTVNGSYAFNPPTTHKVTAGDVLIVVGSVRDLEQLAGIVSSTVH
jgi:voltage-gated potassium channel